MRSSRPRRRKTGDARAAGCTAEHTSCWNPGSVSPADRTPPPIDDAASNTRTESPARAATTAATRPFGPLPTTETSTTSVTRSEPGSHGVRVDPRQSVHHEPVLGPLGVGTLVGHGRVVLTEAALVGVLVVLLPDDGAAVLAEPAHVRRD